MKKIVIEGWEEDALSYPRLQEKIEKDRFAKDKVIAILHEIRAKESTTAINGLITLVKFLANQLYDKIDFVENGVDVKALLETNNLIFVPNHQSYADFVSLNYSFYNKYKRPLYVAGGINLNIFPLGDVFRGCGCFFIRRTFSNDILYKLTLEAYLYYLLKNGKPIEFFFEGGRSRSGKLLSPRYGLYQMILEAHKAIPDDIKKPLLFIPVSLAHEYLPEQRSLAREMRGGKKRAESTARLYKIFRIFAYKMGSIHIHLGNPVIPPTDLTDIKTATQNLAFSCFRRVAKNMLVTPSNLVALILLDEPTGALKWEEIVSRAQKIIAHCKGHNIKLTESLSGDKMEEKLRSSLDMFVSNGRIENFGESKSGLIYYTIKPQFRLELLYFKNAVVHHFLIPWIIGNVWIKMFKGELTTVDELKAYFLEQRSKLKLEFYLPTVKEFFRQTLEHISDLVGVKVEGLPMCMEISQQRKEMFKIISGVGVFSRTVTYIAEGYYITALTISKLEKEFDFQTFFNTAKEIFSIEIDRSMVIKFQESFSLPVLKNGLKYLSSEKIIESKGDRHVLIDPERLRRLISDYQIEIESASMINIRDVKNG